MHMANTIFSEISGIVCDKYEGWNFNSGNYLFTTDTK